MRLRKRSALLSQVHLSLGEGDYGFSDFSLFGGSIVDNTRSSNLEACRPRARSLRGPAPHRRAFQSQDSRWKQGHAFANRVSRNWRLLEEKQESFGCHLCNQQERAAMIPSINSDPKIVIIMLASQRASFRLNFVVVTLGHAI
jgi:hypothetical protein